MTLSSFCESWGVSFDTLVKQHTLGQLVLLAMGSSILGAELETEMADDESSARSPSNKSSARDIRVPPKPFKKMTSRQYLDFLDKAEE